MMILLSILFAFYFVLLAQKIQNVDIKFNCASLADDLANNNCDYGESVYIHKNSNITKKNVIYFVNGIQLSKP